MGPHKSAFCGLHTGIFCFLIIIYMNDKVYIKKKKCVELEYEMTRILMIINFLRLRNLGNI